jgi:hypothetical protein
VDNQLEWIDYYNRHWTTLQKADIDITKKLVETGLPTNHQEGEADYSPLADWLINLNDGKYLLEKGAKVLTDHFVRIPIDKWIKLVKRYSTDHFENIFFTTGRKGKASVIRHLLGIFNDLLDDDTPSVKTFVENQARCLATYLENLKLTSENEKKAVREILWNLLQIDNRKVIKDTTWHKKIAGALTKKLTQEYVNDILIAEILRSGKKSDLAVQLLAVCIEDLQRRVMDQPKPPTSWSRPVPKKSGIYEVVWNILADFLKSSTLQFFDYQALQVKRAEMEYAIKSVAIDIKMETIRKGSPHILRLTKTQDAYQRELAKWKKDVELLKKAELF